MSRNNSKTAHSLRVREAATIKINNSVLKATSSGESKCEIFEALEETNNNYADRMSKLLQFNCRHKKATKVKSHKAEWVDEQARLQTIAKRLDMSITGIIDSVISATPEEESIQEIRDTIKGYHNARHKTRRELTEQLQNIKQIIRESQKNIRNTSSKQEKETKTTSSPDLAKDDIGSGRRITIERNETVAYSSIIAELLMKIRADQAKVWQYWLKQEKELHRDVTRAARDISTALRKDHLRIQDEILHQELFNIISQFCTNNHTTAMNTTSKGTGSSATTSPRLSAQASGAGAITAAATATAAESNSPRRLPPSPAPAAAGLVPVVAPIAAHGSPAAARSPHPPAESPSSPLRSSIGTNSRNTTSTSTGSSSSSRKGVKPGQHSPNIPGSGGERSRRSFSRSFDGSIGMNASQQQFQQQQKTLKEEEIGFELEMLMDEWLQKIAVLDKTHELKIIEKETEKANFCHEIGIPMNNSYANNDNKDMTHIVMKEDKNGASRATTTMVGGWSAEDHDVFVKVYRKAQITGMLRKKMLDLLTAQLPHQSMDAIMTHEEWYRKMKFINNKYKEDEAVYNTTRQDLIAEAKRSLTELRDSKLEAMAKDRELEEHEQRRSDLHARLSDLRAQKEEADAAQRVAQQTKEAELLAKLKEQEEWLRTERLQKKEQVEQFKQLRAAAEQEMQEKLDAEAAAARAQLKQIIEANKPRVEHRAQLLSEKEEKRKQRELELEAEELRRIEVLNQLAAQVPYWESIQSAESRLDHITASAQAHSYLAPDPDSLVRGHLPINGFTDGRVIQDSRFRLAEALRACGVAESRAARSAVAQFFPRPHMAIHGLV